MGISWHASWLLATQLIVGGESNVPTAVFVTNRDILVSLNSRTLVVVRLKKNGDWSLVASRKEANAISSNVVAISDSAVVFGDTKGVITIWKYNDTYVDDRWSAHDGHVTHLAYCPSHNTLASVGADGKLHLHDRKKRRTVATLDRTNMSAYWAASGFASDGSALYLGDRRGMIETYGVSPLSLRLRTLAHDDEVSRIVVSASLMLSCSSDGRIGVWRISKRLTRLESFAVAPKGHRPHAEITTDEKEVIYATGRKVVRWSVERREASQEIEVDGKVSSLSVSGDGNIAVVTPTRILVIRQSTMETVREIVLQKLLTAK